MIGRDMTSRESPECCIAQIKRTLINVENIQTVPVNTLVVDSNLAVVNCIETDTNVCIGIVDITGNVNEQAPLLGATDQLASAREQWRQARDGPRGVNWFSNHLFNTVEGVTGEFAPQNTNNVLIGRDVAIGGQDTSNIAIGDQTVGSNETGLTGATGLTGYSGGQGDVNVAIGYETAFQGQVEANVAIGVASVAGGQLYGNIAIGNPASYYQDTNNVTIGVYAAYSQNSGNIAIGEFAANSGQDTNAIAIGSNAASGNFEGGVQSSHSIAIGSSAGADVISVPEYSIQLGYQANVYSNYEPEGLFNAGVAIGPNSSSSEGALVLNTDIDGLTGSAPGFFVRPIRQLPPLSSQYVLNYDSSTNEISYIIQMISGVSGGGGVSGNGTVNFGITFASIPSVTATFINPGTVNALFSITLYNITTTSFSFYSRFISNTSGGVQPAGEAFNWTAIGYYID